MFDAWFAVELNDAVCDLTPGEPLTQDDVDAADLEEMMNRCASCGIDIDPNDGRFAHFMLADRARYELFEGRVFALPAGDDDGDAVLGLVTRRDSEAARRGEDFIVRVCGGKCEKVARRVVPKALRRWSRRLQVSDE